MANPWDADIELDQDGARRLIESQFPELAPASLERFGQGWDNDAWLVNGTYVFRFPRRKVAAEDAAYELTALPWIAPTLPLPIPNPRFIGAPDESYPYSFGGYALLPGRTADTVPLDDDERARLAPVLGGFLRALHHTPPPEGARPDLLGRTDPAANLERLKGRLEAFAGELLPGLGADEVYARALELSRAKPWKGAPRLVHGDLYARHLLLDDDKQLAGVIDWGDVHVSDPALDFSAVYGFLPPSAWEAFFAVYGAIDDDTAARGRFRALYSGVILLLYGRSIGDTALEGAGETALRFSLS